MSKTDAIARKIMGWKLNKVNRWYDYETETFIADSDFQPEHNLEHAMLIVKRLEQFGYTYTVKGTYKVCFNNNCAKGQTLAEAITNAAYLIADTSSIDDGWL